MINHIKTLKSSVDNFVRLSKEYTTQDVIDEMYFETIIIDEISDEIEQIIREQPELATDEIIKLTQSILALLPEDTI